jgi:RNA polymerase sigma factor (sigma-70 family)
MIENRQLTDQNLVDMIRQGKQVALIKLHQQCYDGIRNHILKNNGNEMDVDDVVQDALIITWQRVIKAEFTLTAKLSTFTHAVAKNLWLNKLRKAGRETSLPEHETADFEWVGELPERKMDMKLVRQCMDEIGETCKTLLSYFYFDGHHMEKIAELMDFSNADTAKSKKYQCLKKLEAIVKSRYKKSDLI